MTSLEPHLAKQKRLAAKCNEPFFEVEMMENVRPRGRRHSQSKAPEFATTN
ncbi:MAG: hypothetical protein AAB316_19355 [Bacteroidota bacterium]